MSGDQQIRKISAGVPHDEKIVLPSSKSYTNRALIAAALAAGLSVISDPSNSDDSTVLIRALEQFDIPITRAPRLLTIAGCNGEMRAPAEIINIGNAGTAMRFLASFAPLAVGTTILDGDEQMRRRPIGMLVDSLRQAGARVTVTQGGLPLRIDGPSLQGGRIAVKAGISSQFLSSLLLAAPYARKPLRIELDGELSSRPYIDMTLHVMRQFGAEVSSEEYRAFSVSTDSRYTGQNFRIEPDASSATYFFAAAAITGGSVHIENLPADSLQGDLRILEILGRMGCRITRRNNLVEVAGGQLHGIEADMNDIPDCVPAIAVTAAFAEGTSRITNIAHLRYKESNRIETLATELRKMGTTVRTFPDSMEIEPGSMHGETIDSYNDHRIAMSFAVAGLRVPGVRIRNPHCVAKSFPGFWDEFAKLETKG